MAPTGYIIFYLIGVILMYLILSQFFIAIIVSAYDAANQEEEEHDREMRLMPGLLELHPPLGRRVLHSIVYFFSGYSLDYACFMPGVRLARVLDELTEEFDDKLVPMAMVKEKLSASGFSPKTIDAVMDTYGQLDDAAAPKEDSGVVEAEAEEEEEEELPDTSTLKAVLLALQNGQAKMLQEQKKMQKELAALQRADSVETTVAKATKAGRVAGRQANTPGSPARARCAEPDSSVPTVSADENSG